MKGQVYQSPSKPRQGWIRPTTVALRDLLEMVENDLGEGAEAVITGWTDYEAFLVQEWCYRSYLRASDNNLVRVPPRPDLLDALPWIELGWQVGA